MDIQPATNPPRSSWARFWPWLIVLAVLLLVGFIRVRLRDMPLERDEGEYAYAGQLILQGIPPYELAYNMKLPGTYYAYALGMAVFGETSAGVHLTLLAANALTIVFVFLLARKLFGTTAGWVACASYAVMSVSPAVFGMAAHANHLVVLFAVPATLLLLRADEEPQARSFFFSGLLYGLAFLMKQQGICFGLFGCLFLVWRAALDKSIFSTAFVKRGLIFGLGIFLPFGFFCLACAIAGDFFRFWLWTFRYAHSYVTALSWSQGWAQLADHLQGTRKLSLGFWLLAAAGPLLAWGHKAARQPTAFVVVFWLFSFLGTAIGLYFRSHYFILLLPAFAMLIGLAVVSLQRMLRLGGMKLRVSKPALGLVCRDSGLGHLLPVAILLPTVTAPGLPVHLSGESIRGIARCRRLHPRTLRVRRAHRGRGFGAGDLFLRAAAFRDRLHLHLRPDGTATRRAGHAA